MNTENNKDDKQLVDDAPIKIMDHLLIRDVASGKVLVNIKNTARNLPPEDSDGNTR
jgi:hypothetical protein